MLLRFRLSHATQPGKGSQPLFSKGELSGAKKRPRAVKPRVASTESIGNAAPAGGCSPAPERQHKSPKQKLAFCRSEAQSFTHSLPVTGAALWVLASTSQNSCAEAMHSDGMPAEVHLSPYGGMRSAATHLASNRSPCVPPLRCEILQIRRIFRICLLVDGQECLRFPKPARRGDPTPQPPYWIIHYLLEASGDARPAREDGFAAASVPRIYC